MNFLNNLKKIKIGFILLVFCLFFSVFFISAQGAKAGDITFNPQVPIPGLSDASVQPDGSTRAIGNYIKGIYNYGIGIVAILATVVMMIGGFQWIIAGGSAEKIGEAKAWITAAISGLVLALSSYMILSLVSPNLVNFKITNIRPVEEIRADEWSECQKIEIGVKQCVDVLGDGWVKVETSICDLPNSPGSCCCRRKEATENVSTETHKECFRVPALPSGYVYRCQAVMGAGPDTCSDNSECNALNSK